ncbi:sterol desaturase family protein [Ferrovibrio sp.]|uniref:sterol desaturase family protein n=1 Tax=Ferrovibrio sp. TaxID=1917215 RepID=UPI001B796C08|nr:sterol desaturase family protein [Ferrovibrio sp.]MBP7063916.1 sterol desaturase family protein [Ferrovibrio sp.]
MNTTLPDPALPDPVVLAIPAFIALAALEVLLARWRGMDAYELKDTAASLLMGLVNLVQGLLFAGLVWAALQACYAVRLFDLPFNAWTWLALLFAEDLAYYWFHRLSHEHRIWWAAHVNHHSSQHYNLSTALRQTWTGNLALTWIVWLPLALLGFPPALIVFQKGVSLVYQFWIHTEQLRRLPRWLEWLFNTPSHHRVHHATNPAYLDRNYAGIFIIWDRLFGTFAAERDDEPCRYGIVKNLGSFNPLVIACHEWIEIGRDLAQARNWRERFGYLFGPPGWAPDGRGRTAADIRAEAAPKPVSDHTAFR